MSPLRQRLIDDLRLRNYSPRTIEAYVAGVARLAKHFNRSPDQLGVEDLRQFQLHLLEQQVSWSLFNVVVSALRFFYGTTLNRPDTVPFIDRVLLQTAYACGLRIGELIHLQVADIDASRMIVTVRQGKGRQDRQVPLSARLLVTLRCHWRSHRSRPWLFPGQAPDRPLHPTNVQRLFQAAVGDREAGDAAHAAALIRHAFARSGRRSGHGPAVARPRFDLDHRALPARESGDARHLVSRKGNG